MSDRQNGDRKGLARIHALRTAAPKNVVPQDDAYEKYYSKHFAEVPKLKEVFANCGVRQRHMAWDPRNLYDEGFPPIKPRMMAWQEHVLGMGREAVAGVLDGVERERVGSFVLASCTGYAGPTPEMLLAKEFGLRQDLRRTFIGHMGCYAAFNALKSGLDSITARPGDLSLVGTAEVCSVHLRPEVSSEQAVVNALFGDAGAMLLLGADDGGPGPVVLATHTETHPETSHAMSWHIEDSAFRMTLSPYVPFYLAETIDPFVKRLLSPFGIGAEDVQHWGIHPGGPKIVEFVGERLHLTEEQLAPTRAVLSEYGNCSSSTILLILDEILRTSRPAPGEYGVVMAFGPGLTMESALVRF
ncbi:type III polyketide synthase [Streptomyces sp. NPDC048172]|uniref:type III polyketide synthase n=1 Tax=Streptomyces sp. NPDC048172 TaxID=3365505 RepID=UPI003714F5A9